MLRTVTPSSVLKKTPQNLVHSSEFLQEVLVLPLGPCIKQASFPFFDLFHCFLMMIPFDQCYSHHISHLFIPVLEGFRTYGKQRAVEGRDGGRLEDRGGAGGREWRTV